MQDLKKIKVPDNLKKEIRSVKEVLEQSNYDSLVIAVLKQMGFDESEDYYNIDNINKNGASGGYHGFIYYNECEEFCKNNQREIKDYIVDFCEETGSMGTDYIDDAMNEIETYVEYDRRDEAEDEDDYMSAFENIDLKILGMCYYFNKWSPYFRDGMDPEDLWDMYRFLGENIYQDDMSSNVFTFLSWFCLEGMCHEFEK